MRLARLLVVGDDAWPTLNVTPCRWGGIEQVAAAAERAGLRACLVDVVRL